MPPEPSKLHSNTILDEAKALIYGDRNASYGHPSEDYGRTVRMFNAWRGADAGPLTVTDALVFMVCVKLSRQRHQRKRDNLVDAVGYLGLIERLAEVTGEK